MSNHIQSGHGEGNMKEVSQHSESQKSLDQFENIDDNKSDFVFTVSNASRGIAKPLCYFWCLMDDLKLWDNIKNYLGENGTTMNNIPLCSRLSYDTPKKKTKHSGLK